MTEVEIAKRYSKASIERLSHMEAALRRLDRLGIEGDVVECGVWRGGHIILARLVSPARRCWLYDTFEGMTAPGPHDRKRSGDKPPPEKALSKSWTMASVDEVVENLRCTGTLDRNLTQFVVGDVAQTLDVPSNLPDRIALLRLDTDWHDSTKKELEVLWPRLVGGGELIVDDWGHWLGARKAVSDYFAVVLPDFKKRLLYIDYTAVAMTKPQLPFRRGQTGDGPCKHGFINCSECDQF